MTDHYLYMITVGCPACDTVTRFVEKTRSPVLLDQDVPLSRKQHCPECGVYLPAIGEEWDHQAEHEIEPVQPTQEREHD